MLSLLTPFLLTLACASTAQTPRSAATGQPARATEQRSDPFPLPKEGLQLAATTQEGGQSLLELLRDFTRVTGQALVIDPSARAALQSTPTGLNQDVAVPASEVYYVVETLLVQHGFLLVQLSDREPRMLAVFMRNGPEAGGLRGRAVFVRAEELQSFARHPALLITTAIDLPHTDVRTLSNSLRALLADQATQQILPVGNSNTLILGGTASNVASWVEMLRAVDDAARQSFERRTAEEKAALKALQDAKAKEGKSDDAEKPR